MWAITLCSVWPTSSGSTRKAASTPTARRVTSTASFIAAPTRGRARPGADTRRRPVGLACSDSPGSLAPGHGLRGAGGEHERLAQRRALEAVGEQQRPQTQAGAVVEPLEVEPEHLVRLALVPRDPAEDPGQAREAGALGDAGAEQLAPQRPRGGPVHEVAHDVEPGRLLVVALVDRREPVEEGVGRVVAGRRDRRHPVGWVDLGALEGARVAHVDVRLVGGCTSGRLTSAAEARRWPAYLARIPLVDKRLRRDLLLELEDALEQRLGPGRAARDVDVDRDDRVDTLGDGVGVPVGAAGVGAGAERDDVLGLGHLVVEPADGGRHLVGHGAGHDHQVGLPRTGRERDDAEADEVVPGHRGGDELDRAAGEAEVEDPQGVAAAPVEDHPDRLRRNVGGETDPGHRQRRRRHHNHLSRPRRAAWTRPTSRTPAEVVVMPTTPLPMPRVGLATDIAPQPIRVVLNWGRRYSSGSSTSAWPAAPSSSSPRRWPGTTSSASASSRSRPVRGRPT